MFNETPTGWTGSKLGIVADVIVSNVDKHILPGEKKVSLCNYMDVYSNEYIDSSHGLSDGTVSQSEYDKFTLKRGDVLITKDSETAQDIARSSAVTHDLPDVVCGYHLAIIRPMDNRVNGFYLKRLFDIPRFQNYYASLANGATRFGLTKPSIENSLVCLPSTEEQERIVAVLETWDEAIERLMKTIELTKTVRSSLMQQLLIGKKRLVGFSGEWPVLALGSMGIFLKGSGITRNELMDSGLSAIRYGELYTKHEIIVKQIYSFISEKSASAAKEIVYGDVLLAGSGETIEDIGRSAAYLGNEKCYAGGDIIIFRPNLHEGAFLSYLFNSVFVRRKLRELGQGQSVVHLYKKDLEKLKLRIPPLDEQKAVANILTAADDEIAELEKKLALVKEQRKFLLNNLVTGKIRTPEDLKMPSKEAARA
jgi:type I restriction enzyme S subunit